MATNNSSNIPTGNTGTVLQGQGVGTALALSTATYPATTTANQVLYSSATNVVGGITAGANGVLITSAGSVPSISSTLPSAVQGNITSTGTIASGVWNGTAVDVSYGGTGRTSLTNHGVLVGAATGAITQLGAGSAGQVLQSGGAGADPAYSTATLPTTATGTGTILRADGTNWVATTATYPTTTTINQILYSSSGDVIGGITSANNGTLITGATGIPSVLANGTTGQLLTATTGAPPSWTTVSSSGTPTKITKYTASDTWTKATSPSPILIQVLVWGGGGSGRKGAASSTRRGGNGGGAGQFINYLTQASAFGASETVTIGGTAAGGSIQTTNSTDGNAGTVGNNTSVGAVVIAYGGTLGVGGNSSGTAPALTAAKQVVFSGSIYPVVSTDLVAVTGAGGSGTTSSPNMNGINGFVSMIPTGGGGGGVITSGNVVNAGGKGGDILAPDNSTAANAGGALGSGAIGGNGNAFTLNYFLYAATGGGGGGSNDAAAAYAGGTGGTPGGGGGGGGGSTNAVGDSGAGNVGARGECWIIEYF